MTFKEMNDNRKMLQNEKDDLEKMINLFSRTQPVTENIKDVKNNAVKFVYNRMVTIIQELEKIDNIEVGDRNS